jgi:hypothetical protein
MTEYGVVYDAFLARILDDEWGNWTQEETEEDLHQILECAIPWFKFPRNSLERNEEGFINDLTSEEIQILATYMKCEWLNRSIMTWENIKPLYTERDFSQANLLDKMNKTLEYERKTAQKLEGNYYRSIKGSPYKYGKWAGNGDE